ncbi:MAG: Asp-tRNA(Asn)/Glu-tRNA(Gln) amidotransferase subunit GatA [Parcubacteria group bacterium]|nr:Asp-tRNA(Asn)/Glu-tRNA(Gln) amidotransferase subunit GatA [Parcubacteria group bacterium]
MAIREIHEQLINKEVSAIELASRCLDRIEQEEIHAFLSVDRRSALAQAKAVDAAIANKENISILAGIPCSIKDAILVEGMPCTAASKTLEHYVAPYEATCVQKLRAQGAVFLGKTNMDEFGMGASTENSAFGPTRNPIDPSRVPGGSSGGSAAAVAAQESVFALGEDTGGSIRLPAAFCGIVGLKPTYGSVSRSGVISLASSLDQVGPFASSVEDVKLIFETIRGRDANDATTVEYAPAVSFKGNIKNLRVGVPQEYFAEGLDPAVEKAVRDIIGKLEKAGAKIREIRLPHTKYALAVYYIINTSEASANLARYDGMRYGLRVPAKTLEQSYLKNRGEGLGTEVKRRIMLGTYALSAGYYDAYYLKAQKVRRLLKQDFEKAFESVDVILGPTSPVVPFKLGERMTDPLAMYLVDIYTVPVNLAGLPALSVPAGSVDRLPAGQAGLPVGLHLISKPFDEQTLFETGTIIEQIR